MKNGCRYERNGKNVCYAAHQIAFFRQLARFQHAKQDMQITREQAQEQIEDLQLPEFFLELFFGERTLRELGLSAPEQIFRLRNAPLSYRIIPIFEYNGRTYCCEQHPEGPRFVAIPNDEPGDPVPLGKSFQCVLASLFIDFWQDDRNDFILPMLADALEFRRFDELIQEVAAANKLPKAQYLRWRADFCAKCEENEVPFWSQSMPIGAVA